jgi:hypothetical protein
MSFCGYCTQIKPHPLFLYQVRATKTGEVYANYTTNFKVRVAEANSSNCPAWAKQGQKSWELVLVVGPFEDQADLVAELGEKWQKAGSKVEDLAVLLREKGLLNKVHWFQK